MSQASIAGPDISVAQVNETNFLSGMWRTFRRRKLLIATTMLTSFAILGTGVQFLPKTYRAVAAVEVESLTPRGVVQDIFSAQGFTEETMGTAVAQINSYDVLAAAAQKVNLINDPEFNDSLSPSALKDFITDARQRVSKLFAEFMPIPPPVPEGANRVLLQVVDNLRGKTVVAPVTKSRVLNISVTTSNPNTSALLANTIVQVYIQKLLDRKATQISDTNEFATNRLNELRAAAIKSAQAVEAFRADHGIVSGEKGGSIVSEQLTQLSNQLFSAREKANSLASQRDAAKTGDPTQLPIVQASPVIAELRKQLGEAISLRARMTGGGYGSANTGRYDRQISDLEATINKEARRIAASIPIQLAEANRTLEQLSGNIDDLKRQVSQNQIAQAGAAILATQAGAAQDVYREFINKSAVTDPGVQWNAMPAANVQIVGLSPPPLWPHFPKNIIMLPASLVLSGVFAGLLAYMVDSRRRGVINLLEIEQRFGVQGISVLPQRDKRAAIQAYDDGVEHAFNRLLYAREGQKVPQTFVITSAADGEGKTSTALALASVARDRGMKVLIVDADERNDKGTRSQHAVHRTDSAIPVRTLREVLNLPSYSPLSHNALVSPTRSTKGDYLISAVESLKIEFDVIFFDCPPVGKGNQGWVMSRIVDRWVLVSAWGRTPPEQISWALWHMSPQPGMQDNFAGVILNNAPLREMSGFGHPETVVFHPARRHEARV